MTFKGFAREEQVSTWNIDLNIGEVINNDLKEAERISKGMSANNAMQDRWSNMYLDALVNKHDVEKSNRDTNFKFFMENREAIRKAEADNYKIEIADAGKTGPAPISETIIPKLFELAVNVGSTALKQWVQGEVEKKEEAKAVKTKEYKAASMLYGELDGDLREKFEAIRDGANEANHKIELQIAEAVGLDPARMAEFRKHLGSTAGQLAQEDGMSRNMVRNLPDTVQQIIKGDETHRLAYEGKGSTEDIANLVRVVEEASVGDNKIGPLALQYLKKGITTYITNPASRRNQEFVNKSLAQEQRVIQMTQIHSSIEKGGPGAFRDTMLKQAEVRAKLLIKGGMSEKHASYVASEEQLTNTLDWVRSGLNAGDISTDSVIGIKNEIENSGHKGNRMWRGLNEIIQEKNTADQRAYSVDIASKDKELATTISSHASEMKGNLDELRAFFSSMQERLKGGGGGKDTIEVMKELARYIAEQTGAPIAGEAPQLNQSQFKLFNDIISYTDTAIRNELLTEGKTVTDVMNTSSAEIATNRFINSLVQEEINNFPPGTPEDVIMQKVMDDLSDPDTARYKKLKDLRTLEKDDLERWRFSKLEIADTPNNRNSKEYVASTSTILHEDKGNPTRYFDFVKKEKTHYGTKAWLQNVGKRLEFDPNGLSVIHMLNNPPPAVVEFMERSGLSASEFVNQMSDTVGINKIPEHIHISPEESSRANAISLEIYKKFKSNTPINKQVELVQPGSGYSTNKPHDQGNYDSGGNEYQIGDWVGGGPEEEVSGGQGGPIEPIGSSGATKFDYNTFSKPNPQYKLNPIPTEHLTEGIRMSKGEIGRGQSDPNQKMETAIAIASALNRTVDPAWGGLNLTQVVQSGKEGGAKGQYEGYDFNTQVTPEEIEFWESEEGSNLITNAIITLAGRDSFKGVSERANLGKSDVSTSEGSNFYHHRGQNRKDDPIPQGLEPFYLNLLTPQTEQVEPTREQSVVDHIRRFFRF